MPFKIGPSNLDLDGEGRDGQEGHVVANVLVLESLLSHLEKPDDNIPPAPVPA